MTQSLGIKDLNDIEIKTVFKKIDHNNDGQINLKEFIQFISTVCIKEADARKIKDAFHVAFNTFSPVNDKITKDNFKKIVLERGFTDLSDDKLDKMFEIA